ncbi:hypothetical protein ACFQT0_21005 [Hymenobacter humi]|uniref:Uncharacterized protein n=1 Tax=Hymenobacter humi TaxID=1411620 RepID=A0ABW2U7X4_9BACT
MSLVGESLYRAFPAITEPVRRVLAGERVSFTGTGEVEGEPGVLPELRFF